MAWVKIDDQARHHRKLLAAGAAAAWMWTCGLMYCNAQKARDGFIPEEAVAVLYPIAGWRREAARLVSIGLWERVEGGYVVHDYHDYQPTAEEAERVREQKAAAGREGARARKIRKLSPEMLEPSVGTQPCADPSAATTPGAVVAENLSGFVKSTQQMPSSRSSAAQHAASARQKPDPDPDPDPVPIPERSGGALDPPEAGERGVPASEWAMHQALFVAAYESAVRAATGNPRWSLRRTNDLQRVLASCCLGAERGDIEGWIRARVGELVTFIATVPESDRRFWEDPDAGAMLRWFNRKRPAHAAPSASKRDVSPPYLAEYVDPYETTEPAARPAGGSR